VEASARSSVRLQAQVGRIRERRFMAASRLIVDGSSRPRAEVHGFTVRTFNVQVQAPTRAALCLLLRVLRNPWFGVTSPLNA
jgi:hypothetical protein